MNHLAVLLLSLPAFGAPALATDRHQKIAFGRRLTSGMIRGLRLSGWSALVLVLFVAVREQGWALGLVSYSGHTSLAAGIIFWALIANERRKTLH